MFFSKALLTATYKDGRPGRPTEAHEKAEHHRFKKDFLYKKPAISKELYASRLIQHFLILQALESQLKNLSDDAKTELNAFFTLSYLDQLWRTSAMAEDLRVLDVNPDTIQKRQTAPATELYLEQIKKLKPKELLAHFLLHVVGFIHGGTVIQSKFIKPSNQLTSYQIPAKQYDFSAATLHLAQGTSVMALYQDMMNQVDKISLDPDEYEQIAGECLGIYETMTSIYDDLCTMHAKQFKLSDLALFAVALVAVALNVKAMMDLFNVNNQSSLEGPRPNGF